MKARTAMDTMRWKRILAATDFSPLGNRAVAEAHVLAEKFGTELHVLHVVDSADGIATQAGVTGTLDIDEATTGPKAWLGELLGERGTVRRVDAVQIGQDVADKILQYARAKEIDAIVVASHGRTGWHVLTWRCRRKSSSAWPSARSWCFDPR